MINPLMIKERVNVGFVGMKVIFPRDGKQIRTKNVFALNVIGN